MKVLVTWRKEKPGVQLVIPVQSQTDQTHFKQSAMENCGRCQLEPESGVRPTATQATSVHAV